MIREKLEVLMEGKVTFQLFDASGKLLSEWTKKNAIQSGAKDIVARNLIADPPAKIETISLYYLGNLVKTITITQRGVVSNAQISFQSTFEPADFTGSFDAARLTTADSTDFSIIGGLVGTKDGTHSLVVTWNILIN